MKENRGLMTEGVIWKQLLLFALPLLLGTLALLLWANQPGATSSMGVYLAANWQAPFGIVLVLYAVQSAPISHVAPAREVSMLFAALIGGKLLGEGDRALRIVGAIMIALYVLPYILQSNIANAHVQGEHRHTFWAEVYETVLAWYVALPTTVALINPRLGKFNVTAKGGLVDEPYFEDRKSVV